MTARTLESADFFTITLLSIPSVPQLHLHFSGSFIPFLPPPYPYPISIHLSPIDAAYLSLCTHFSPPPYLPGAEQPFIFLTAPPPAGLYRSSTLYSPAGKPEDLLVWSCVCLPLSGCLPFFILDLRNQVHVGPRVLPPMGTFLSMYASTIRTPTPLSSSTGGLVPCRSRVVASWSLSPPSPVHPPLHPCVSRRLLVSSEV